MRLRHVHRSFVYAICMSLPFGRGFRREMAGKPASKQAPFVRLGLWAHPTHQVEKRTCTAGIGLNCDNFATSCISKKAVQGSVRRLLSAMLVVFCPVCLVLRSSASRDMHAGRSRKYKKGPVRWCIIFCYFFLLQKC